MDDLSDKNAIPSAEYVQAFMRFIVEVFRLNGQLLNSADRLSKDLDLSASRWQTIGIVHRKTITVAAIARRLSLSRQSVQQTINRLEKQGIVELTDNPNHRTSPLVQLTAHGQEVRGILADRQAHVTATLTEELGYTIKDIDRMTHQLQYMREQAAQLDLLQFAPEETDEEIR